MVEKISGEDVICAKLRAGDLLCLDPLSSHRLRNSIMPTHDEITEHLDRSLYGKPVIYTDVYLVLDTKMVNGVHVEVSFLCMDGTDRGVVVETFEALSAPGACCQLIVGPTPMDCRGVLTSTGPRDRMPSLSIKSDKPPRVRVFNRSEYGLLALTLLVIGITLFTLCWS